MTETSHGKPVGLADRLLDFCCIVREHPILSALCVVLVPAAIAYLLVFAIILLMLCTPVIALWVGLEAWYRANGRMEKAWIPGKDVLSEVEAIMAVREEAWESTSEPEEAYGLPIPAAEAAA